MTAVASEYSSICEYSCVSAEAVSKNPMRKVAQSLRAIAHIDVMTGFERVAKCTGESASRQGTRHNL